MGNETWKTLQYNGEVYDRFEVSDDGRLRNVITGTIYRQHINKEGYSQVCVSLGSRNKKKVFKIHKAVAETYIPNDENKSTVNHIDGNKQNNSINNLEWATNSENVQHAFDTGLNKPKIGTEHWCSKLSIDDVKYIRDHYIKNDVEYGSRALGRKFGIDHCKILDVVKYESYKNI